MNVDLDVIDQPLIGYQLFIRQWREMELQCGNTANMFRLLSKAIIQQKAVRCNIVSECRITKKVLG